MRTRAVSGLGLVGAAAVCLTGAALAPAPAAWVSVVGAWLAVVSAALVYRDLARHNGRRRTAVALALLGVVASARTVEATLLAANTRWSTAQPLSAMGAAQAGWAAQPLLVAGAVVGLVLLAYAAGRAGLAGPVLGACAATAALLGAFLTDPYTPGAGLLGAAVLVRTISKGTTG